MSDLKNKNSHKKTNNLLTEKNEEKTESLSENDDQQTQLFSENIDDATTPLIEQNGEIQVTAVNPSNELNPPPPLNNAFDDETAVLLDSGDQEASTIQEDIIANNDKSGHMNFESGSAENLLNSSTNTIKDDEATEELLENNVPQAKKSKRHYVLIGIIAGFCILTVLAFLVPVQMKASEINKALDLGEKYLEEGKYEEALVAFDDVIAIEPKQVAAYEGKGSANIGLKNYTEAEAQLETAKSIESTDNGNVLLADVYINTDRKDQGKSLLDEVANKHPEEIKVVVHASKLYTEINEYSKVIELLENKISNTTNKEDLKKLYSELINGFVKSGKTQEEILALLERAASATGDQSYIQKKESYIVKEPKFNLAPGEYKGAQNLEIVKGNAGDKIFYTIDGSEPSQASTEYTGPISLNPSEITVKVIEVNEIGVKSPVLEGKYIIKENKLTNEEFINKLNGIWYCYFRGLTHILHFTDSYCINQRFAGSLGQNIGGYYEVVNTTENGGTIKISKCHFWKSTLWDIHPKEPEYFEFNFGTPNDNRIIVNESGSYDTKDFGEWTAAPSLGNDEYEVPNIMQEHSYGLTKIKLHDTNFEQHLQHPGNTNFGM